VSAYLGVASTPLLPSFGLRKPIPSWYSRHSTALKVVKFSSRSLEVACCRCCWDKGWGCGWVCGCEAGACQGCDLKRGARKARGLNLVRPFQCAKIISYSAWKHSLLGLRTPRTASTLGFELPTESPVMENRAPEERRGVLVLSRDPFSLIMIATLTATLHRLFSSAWHGNITLLTLLHLGLSFNLSISVSRALVPANLEAFAYHRPPCVESSAYQQSLESRISNHEVRQRLSATRGEEPVACRESTAVCLNNAQMVH
jgi:hypothetical protein